METSNQLRNFSALKKSKVQSLPEIRLQSISPASLQTPNGSKALAAIRGQNQI
jgi:hypothetical protein